MRVGTAMYLANYGDWERYDKNEFDRPSEIPDHQVYDEGVLRLGSLVEPLGFDSVWSVEHHFNPYTMIPDPLQLLTFFAGRTERVDLGTCVIVLPWHNPVEIAEKICVLDCLLSGRKLRLGFGRGAGRVEYGGFNIPMGESRDRFNEALDVIRLGLTTERFSYEGTYYQVKDISIRPRPLSSDLLDRMYMAWGSPSSVTIAADLDLKPLIIPQKTWDEISSEMSAYNTARATRGLGPERPIVGGFVICADTHDEAYRLALRHLPESLDNALRNYELRDAAHFAEAGGYEYYAKMAEMMARVPTDDLLSGADMKTHGELTRGILGGIFEYNVWGTPDECIAKLAVMNETLNPTEYIAAFYSPGAMSADHAERSMTLFSEEVLPALHAWEPGAP